MALSFPEVKGSNLEGRKFQIPQDLKGDLNLLVIAFKYEHQILVDSWITFLEDLVKSNLGFYFYEIPTLAYSYLMMRWMIDGGMRAGIPDKKARERTITLYLNKKKFRQALHVPDEETICLFLINKNGQILWQSRGEFTETKGIDLEEKIKER